MNNHERIKEVINTPRMSCNTDEEGNYSRGLYELIKENFKPEFRVLQIGTFEGVTAELFALTCKSVVTVDPYDDGYNFQQESKELLIRAEDIAKQRLSKYSNIEIIKQTSAEYYMTLKAFSLFDAIYIDGDHTDRGIRFDLDVWPVHIKKGGFICGHDVGTEIIFSAIKDILSGYDKKYEDGSWIKRV